MKPKLPFLTLLLSLLFVNTYSQTATYNNSFSAIEAAIIKNENLSQSRDTLELLLTQTRLAKNDIAIARCYASLLVIDDKKTEDSLYFKNSAFIDSIITASGTTPLLKGVMHLMQAKRINYFLRQGKWDSKHKLFSRTDVINNYALLNDDQLKDTITYNYEQSKKYLKEITNVDIENALWLSGDPLIFLFKPTLYDITVAEEVKFIKENEKWVNNSKFNLLPLTGLTQADFIKAIDTITTNKPLLAYKAWMAYHDINKDPAAVFFIETLARKYIHSIQYLEVDTSRTYERYLESIITSPHAPVKAHGVYQLFEIWRSYGLKYCLADDRRYYYYTLTNNKYYNPAYKEYFKKAIALYDNNQALLGSFLYLKNSMAIAIQNIKEKELNLDIQLYNLPGKPILARISYKNIQTAYLKIYQVPNNYNNEKTFDTSQLIHTNAFIKTAIKLPVTDDYQPHSFLYNRCFASG